MYTKIIAHIIQSCFIAKVLIPPTKYGSIKEIIATEGLSGAFFQYFIAHATIISALIQSSLYIFIMYQQKIGFEWNLLDNLWLLTTGGGCLLRFWCYKSLKDFFTFNVTIKKDHKLINTGPYSLLVHPSYTGFFLMLTGISLLWYQLYSYIPVSESLLNLIYCYHVFQLIWSITATLKRVTYEEKVLKKNFDKEWDVYFSQRKRFIPFII